MPQLADPVVVAVPRTVLNEITVLTDELRERMHDLLERNTEGTLGETEKRELELLVRIAEFGQIVSLALDTRSER